MGEWGRKGVMRIKWRSCRGGYWEGREGEGLLEGEGRRCLVGRGGEGRGRFARRGGKGRIAGRGGEVKGKVCKVGRAGGCHLVREVGEG